ncbi:MAG TPA: 3-methyladenine DNA glycosylase [Marmoricola sp.]|nr:3-methyladenine DNA glycosylase [Marmoricola sp.]
MESATRTGIELLDPSSWQAAAERHAARVEPWVGPHLDRRRHRVPHPVEDFLFAYYSYRPAALRRWHPGFGFALVDEERSALKGYGDLAAVVGTPGAVGVTLDHVSSQRPLLEALRTLLAATASRPAHFGCFGLHEWAMVYRQPPDQVRHGDWPLRLGAAGTDEVVESHRVACSHFDAFRFFTDPARPLNVLQPGRDDRPAFEQPACLHAGMDLYKHAFRLSPMVASELVADCFELAREIRVLDMRASPYDLADLGYEPVRIETVEGKQEYTAAQRVFAERGAPLRGRLLDEVDRLLAAVS